MVENTTLGAHGKIFSDNDESKQDIGKTNYLSSCPCLGESTGKSNVYTSFWIPVHDLSATG